MGIDVVLISLNYRGKTILIEQLPNGKFKKPDLSQFINENCGPLTWLDDCRIPYQNEDDKAEAIPGGRITTRIGNFAGKENLDIPRNELDKELYELKGRFPANLLVSDDVLNDGKITKSIESERGLRADIRGNNFCNSQGRLLPNSNTVRGYNDEGSYSRYFSLDQWASKTFPFLIVPKASRSERGKFNTHATVKPLKLMSYLITLGSREGDLVLDPFCGSGTVCIAADQLHRKWIGIERNEEYAQIIKKRLMVPLSQLKMTVYD